MQTHVIAHPETSKCYIDEEGNVLIHFCPDHAQIHNLEISKWENMTPAYYKFYSTYDPFAKERKS